MLADKYHDEGLLSLREACEEIRPDCTEGVCKGGVAKPKISYEADQDMPVPHLFPTDSWSDLNPVPRFGVVTKLVTFIFFPKCFNGHTK